MSIPNDYLKNIRIFCEAGAEPVTIILNLPPKSALTLLKFPYLSANPFINGYSLFINRGTMGMAVGLIVAKSFII
jgi:hypothetical protein